MLDRLARLRSQNIVKDVWPDRHIVGPDGTPVPFHIAQNEIFDSERRTVALVGGSQLGKTTLAPWWLYREIKLRGSGDYIAATSSFDLFRLKLLPSLLQVFEEILQLGRYWVGDKVFELKDPVTGKFLAQRATDHMWGRIILRSAQSLSGLESATAKGAILDEAGQDEFPIEAWRAILRRLTLHRGRILLTTTLYNCYDETTEIYTRNGWKTFGNLDDSDEVFACDATGVGDFEKPERIYWSRYSGKMINLLGGRINLCVTPNH